MVSKIKTRFSCSGDKSCHRIIGYTMILQYYVGIIIEKSKVSVTTSLETKQKSRS